MRFIARNRNSSYLDGSDLEDVFSYARGGSGIERDLRNTRDFLFNLCEVLVSKKILTSEEVLLAIGTTAWGAFEEEKL